MLCCFSIQIVWNDNWLDLLISVLFSISARLLTGKQTASFQKTMWSVLRNSVQLKSTKVEWARARGSVGITLRRNGPQLRWQWLRHQVAVGGCVCLSISLFAPERLRFAKKYLALTIITVICWSISCSSGESGKRESCSWTLCWEGGERAKEPLIYEQPLPRSDQRSCSRTKCSAWPNRKILCESLFCAPRKNSPKNYCAGRAPRWLFLGKMKVGCHWFTRGKGSLFLTPPCTKM
jgi:hypothetical protein